MRSSGMPTDFQIATASSSAGMPGSPAKTVTESWSGEKPSFVVRNSKLQEIASFLK